jgi:hypothetical protein
MKLRPLRPVAIPPVPEPSDGRTAFLLGWYRTPRGTRVELLPAQPRPECPITRADERRIFNDPEYWTSMPALEGAADSIKSIRTGFLLPVQPARHAVPSASV